jgi:uncharacterized protein (TIRG00374 family)
MDSNNNNIISRSKIMKGIKLFIALTAAGILFILYRSSFSGSLTHLRNFDLTLLAAIVGLVIFDWFISGVRVYIFAVKVHPDIPFAGCIRANLVNIFMGGVTPSQTGGGAGQVYILYKEGMGAMDATISSFLSFISTALFLPTCGIFVIAFVKPDFQNVTLQYLSSYTLLLFSLILAAVAISLIDPALFEKIVRKLAGVIPILRRKFVESSAFDTFIKTFRRYHNLMLYFLKDGLHFLVAGFFLTAVMFFNKFVVAFLVIRGLGIQANFWEVIYLQLILILVFYFAPTPGSSGVAEVSTAFIMGQIIPKAQTGVFVILWRFFTLFVGMLAGGYVLLRYLLRRERGESAPGRSPVTKPSVTTANPAERHAGAPAGRHAGAGAPAGDCPEDADSGCSETSPR